MREKILRYSIVIYIIIIVKATLYSQSGSITNIQVRQQTDNSGLVDVYFDLTGPNGDYYLNMEVSFEGGTAFASIASNYLSGDIGPINPGNNKHIIWDGGQSFPDTYSLQSQLKIIASNFICGGILIDDRDEQTYATVQIGSQCWMAENLNIGNLINEENNQTNNGITEKYCYNNSEAMCDEYGGLYQWNETMQYGLQESSQGICPAGWHVPSDEEWKQMEMALGMSQSEADDDGSRGTDEGEKMKSTNGWVSYNGTNSSGFNVFPAGTHGDYNDTFAYLGRYSHMWTSTATAENPWQPEELDPWFRFLTWNNQNVWRTYTPIMLRGFSVRCLKN